MGNWRDHQMIESINCGFKKIFAFLLLLYSLETINCCAMLEFHNWSINSKPIQWWCQWHRANRCDCQFNFKRKFWNGKITNFRIYFCLEHWDWVTKKRYRLSLIAGCLIVSIYWIGSDQTPMQEIHQSNGKNLLPMYIQYPTFWIPFYTKFHAAMSKSI